MPHHFSRTDAADTKCHQEVYNGEEQFFGLVGHRFCFYFQRQCSLHTLRPPTDKVSYKMEGEIYTDAAPC